MKKVLLLCLAVTVLLTGLSAKETNTKLLERLNQVTIKALAKINKQPGFSVETPSTVAGIRGADEGSRNRIKPYWKGDKTVQVQQRQPKVFSDDFNRAEEMFNNKDYAGAIKIYSVIIKTSTDDSTREPARFKLGLVYAYDGDYLKAIKELQGYIETYPSGVFKTEARELIDNLIKEL